MTWHGALAPVRSGPFDVAKAMLRLAGLPARCARRMMAGDGPALAAWAEMGKALVRHDSVAIGRAAFGRGSTRVSFGPDAAQLCGVGLDDMPAEEE